MDVGWLAWLLENVPTRLLDALEIVALACVFIYFKLEIKKMNATIALEKMQAEEAYAPNSVTKDVQELKAEISDMHKKIDTGFNNISLQISGLSQSVIAAVSRK